MVIVLIVAAVIFAGILIWQIAMFIKVDIPRLKEARAKKKAEEKQQENILEDDSNRKE